jgi:hypothetical protein
VKKPFTIEFKFPSGRPGFAEVMASNEWQAREFFVDGKEYLREIIVKVHASPIHELDIWIKQND